MSNRQSNPQSKLDAIGTATVEVVGLLQALDLPIYVFAGFALYLHGLEDKADDGDIRMYHPDILELRDFIASKTDRRVSLRGIKQYSRGIYANECIEVDTDIAGIDVCTLMVLRCDLGRFEFPFDRATFEDIAIIEYQGVELPVASIEFLLLYYLALRRGEADGKEDEARIQRILASPKLDHNKFKILISNFPQAEQLLALYTDRLPQ